jgi:molybdopterin/thiamine biosynthesis adenylyltransferase
MEEIPSRLPPGPLAVLSLEREPVRGALRGVVLSRQGAEPIHALRIVGAGMHRVLTPEGTLASLDPPVPAAERARWSRAIGALGAEPWRRLRALRLALVGVGRSGSAFACSLWRAGVRELTFSDPDVVEAHNLDAMDGVTDMDVGRPKVAAVGGALAAINPAAPPARALQESIFSLRALVAAKEAHLLVTCVDDDRARLAAGVIAALYARPMLEIATGIMGSGQARRMAGDVRLILPGERCLLCLGGVADLARARTAFTTVAPIRAARTAWQDERAGSLRSLNQIAVHLGMRLLEDFVAERVQTSRWIHLEFDAGGTPSLATITPPPDPACPLCRHTGEADDGLGAVRQIVAGLEGPEMGRR